MLCVAFFFHFINLMHFLHTYVLLIKVVFLFRNPFGIDTFHRLIDSSQEKGKHVALLLCLL
jgi:hypothetical protein